MTAPVLSLSRIGHIDRNAGDRMVKKHYLRRWPGVCTCIIGMSGPEGIADQISFDGINYVGVVVFALPPRETIVRYGGLTWELARLWIDDAMPKNSESWLLGKAAWHVRKNHPDVTCLVSYADPTHGHQGTIYKAAGWASDGMSSQLFDRIDAYGNFYSRTGHIPPGRETTRIVRQAKHRFIMRMNKRKATNP